MLRSRPACNFPLVGHGADTGTTSMAATDGDQRAPGFRNRSRAKSGGEQVFGEEKFPVRNRNDDVDWLGQVDIFNTAVDAPHDSCRPLAPCPLRPRQ